TTLAYVSSIATRCRLGVAVLALPPRNPVLVAKQVATLDALSEGRVILGVGTGWIEEELRYLGASWSVRGRMERHGPFQAACLTKLLGCSGSFGVMSSPTPFRVIIRPLQTSHAFQSQRSPVARRCSSEA